MNRVRAALLGLLTVYFAHSGTFAQQRATAPDTPNQTTSHRAPQRKPFADYSQEPVVIDQYFMSLRFETSGASESRLDARIRIQNGDAASQVASLIFPPHSPGNSIDVHYLRVRHADSTVTSIPAQTALNLSDFKLPSLLAGDTLESEIVVRAPNPEARNEFWASHNFLTDPIVLDERFEVNLPATRAVLVKSSRSAPEKSEQNGRAIYRWKHANLAHRQDSDASKPKSPYAATQPDIQVTSFATWESVARWYAASIETATDPTPEIQSKVAELTQGHANDLDKIRAIYQYISKSIHFVEEPISISPGAPRSAAQILTDGKGNAVGKTILFASMCRAAKLSCDAALLPYARKLDPTFPSPAQFDHVVTVFPQRNDLFWMDATQDVAPFRFLASVLRGKSALLVPPDGPGKLATTPSDPPFPSTQQVRIDAQVSELGKLTGQLHYVLRGDTEFVLRRAFHDAPQTQWKQLAQTIMTLDGLRGDVVSVQPSNPLDTENPFELQISFTQINFLDWSSKSAKVAMPLLTLGLPDAPTDPSKPIELGSPLSVTTKLNIAFPDNFNARAPVGISASRDYAEFKSSYQYENRSLMATRSLDFKMPELAPVRASDYLAFTHTVQADENQGLVVENISSGAAAIPPDSTPDELLETGLAALDSGNTRSAIPLFQRIVELDPAHKQAWNDLGLAYLRAGNLEQATAAFQKQIEIDPSVGHLYDYLGLALQRQQKLDDATAAFQKQIELDPLDTIAHAALGGLYLAELKYKEAIPELDKAAVLSPESAELEISLGQAYRNTGQDKEAIAAFEKGASLSQSPAVWDTVARNLAPDDRDKLDLVKARQYAEAAVSATTGNLAKLDVSHLTGADFARVANLGNFWDTLGWVYFLQGDATKGERFIQSSWLLTQNGEAADHLAQIAEKRGQKDQAARMFALALAAPNSPAGTRARLTLLLGSNSGIDDLVSKTKPSLPSLRTLSAGKLLAEDAHADFLLLLSPAGSALSTHAAAQPYPPNVDNVVFLSGNAKLAPFASRLRSLNYGPVFPDTTLVKLIRRATLSCFSKSGACELTLAIPGEVRPPD